MNYFFKLECNAQNILVLTLEKDSRDIALIVYEDLNREEVLDVDFPYLKDKLHKNSEYKDIRNLISIIIFPIFDRVKNEELKKEIEFIAENFIEHRGLINTKINWFNDKKVTDLYKDIGVNKINLLKYLFEFCENKYLDNDIDEYNFSHLNQ